MRMKVMKEDAGPCRKNLLVSVPAEEVSPEYAMVVEGFAKASRIAGFRPGKAPTAVVERHYERAIVQETKERLVPRLYRAALKQEAINAVAIVGVGDVVLNKDTGLSFKMIVDVPPEFKLPKYHKISVKGESAGITDEQADQAFERFLQAYSRYEDVAARPVRETDLVQVDYRGECGGQPVAALAPDAAGLGEGADFWIMVGGQELVPGLSKGLLGAAVGERRAVPVAFPADFGVPALAGRDAVYTVQVKGIRERVPPALDAEFLKRFEADSEAALRAKIRTRLAAEAELAARNRMKGQIVRFLIEETKLDIPQSVVEEETGLTIRGMVQRIAAEGGTREQIIEKRDAIYNTALASAQERVKMAYILSRIADEEKLAVEDGEVDARIQRMAADFGMPPEKMRAELEKRNGIEGLRSEIRAEKTLDFLLEHARIKS
jgi:trigger factor